MPAIVVVFSALMPSLTYPSPPEYTLSSGDRLRVTVFGRPDMSGQFEIRPSGSISLPLLGDVVASDQTLESLETSLTTKLRGIFADPPFVNVEVEFYKPFYILGDVAQPGAYPYQYGMSVIRAIAVAGGRRFAGDFALEARGEGLTTERARSLLDPYIVDRVREARLVAEREELESVNLPEELLYLRNNPRFEEVLDNELRIFSVRREALSRRLHNAKDESAHFQRLVDELRATKEALEEKQKLVEAQIREMTRGANRGVIPRLDLLRTQNARADTVSQVRQNNAAISRAELGLLQVERNLSDFLRRWREDVLNQLQIVQARLAQSRLPLRSASASDFAHNPRPDRSNVDRDAPGYYIRRARDPGSEEVAVSLDAWVFPGDLVRVAAPGPAFLLVPRSNAQVSRPESAESSAAGSLPHSNRGP